MEIEGVHARAVRLGWRLKVAERAGTDFGNGADLVRILSKLTSDVERFDMMIGAHRNLLEQRMAHGGAVDDMELNSLTDQLSHEAAEMLRSVRQAPQT